MKKMWLKCLKYYYECRMGSWNLERSRKLDRVIKEIES